MGVLVTASHASVTAWVGWRTQKSNRAAKHCAREGTRRARQFCAKRAPGFLIIPEVEMRLDGQVPCPTGSTANTTKSMRAIKQTERREPQNGARGFLGGYQELDYAAPGPNIICLVDSNNF